MIFYESVPHGCFSCHEYLVPVHAHLSRWISILKFCSFTLFLWRILKKIFYITFGRCLAKSRDFTLFILWPRVCSGKCQESRTVWCKAKNPQLAISHLRKSQQGNSESRKNRLQPLLQEKNVRKTTNKQTKMWKNPNLSDSQNKNGVNS